MTHCKNKKKYKNGDFFELKELEYCNINNGNKYKDIRAFEKIYFKNQIYTYIGSTSLRQGNKYALVIKYCLYDSRIKEHYYKCLINGKIVIICESHLKKV
jgi:hypothetical protein